MTIQTGRSRRDFGARRYRRHDSFITDYRSSLLASRSPAEPACAASEERWARPPPSFDDVPREDKDAAGRLTPDEA